MYPLSHIVSFAIASPWGRATVTIVLAVVALLAIYHDTLITMVKIWRTSDTFAHCFLIFPISAYLIWQRRLVLVGTVPRADYRALFVVALLGLGWLLAKLGEVKVMQQFSMVVMIPAFVWAALGWRIVSQIAFPLAFLLFSVPFGEFLIPKLINFTADFTVAMIKLTGIPVYREGTHFSIPSGDWSVVEACSGLRYLIASITLGCLFAYFNYQSTLRRTLFILLAGIVPVFANGFRAYLIVMIAHLSDMTLAVGVDHLIYGWVFFGVVMSLLFWAGSYWREEPSPAVATSDGSNLLSPGQWREGCIMASAISALAVSAIWPMRASYVENRIMESVAPVSLTLPDAITPWRRAAPMTDWEPRYTGASAEGRAFYANGRHTVALFIKYYRLQEQDKELINSQNSLTPEKSSSWNVVNESSSQIRLAPHQIQVLQGDVRSARQELLTWRWYWIAGRHVVNEYLAKIFHAGDKFFGRIPNEAAIILAIDVKDSPGTARNDLQNFVDVMMPAIEQALANSARGGGAETLWQPGAVVN